MTATVENISTTARPLGDWTCVRAAVEDEIAWVVLNRPDKRNCMSPTLNDEMLEVLDAVTIDEQVRVMILTGEGEAFTAGMDLKEFFRDSDALSPGEREVRQRSAFDWQGPRLRNLRVPSIAMVNGYCFGGGFVPLVNCDLAVAAEDAVFGLSEINWGIIPGGNVPTAYMHTMSMRDAMYYSITGETFTGTQAAEMKLINEAVPRDDLRKRVVDIADSLKVKNPAIIRSTKELVRHMRTLGYAEAENYINAKFAEAQFNDAEAGRQKGLTQFLDEKSIRPGFQAYQA